MSYMSILKKKKNMIWNEINEFFNGIFPSFKIAIF